MSKKNNNTSKSKSPTKKDNVESKAPTEPSPSPPSAVAPEIEKEKPKEETPSSSKPSNPPPKDKKKPKDSTRGDDVYSRLVSSFEQVLNEDASTPIGCLKSFSIDGIADYIQKYNPKNIIFMVGAGISTSAGIPDFRTPGTGLYDNLAKYNLPAPELIFSIDLFRENPIPFFDLAKDLFMSDAKPTLAHYFMRLMTEKGHVRRIYTQNIDTLEYMAGTPPDKVITAHGSHYSNTCQKCRAKYDQQWMIDHFYRAQDLVATCTKCKGVVKPDIVFFGENLPLAFYQNVGTDFDACDLLIIMGTSLVVYPVAGIVDSVKSHTPRLLINLEPAGAKHLRYHKKHGNKRDVFYQSSADDGCRKLAELLGYLPELEQLMAHEIKKLDQQRKEKPKKLAPSGSILLRNN